MRAHVVLPASAALGFLVQVVAQSSNVTTCTPEYQWSINSEHQTPCLVASYLESACGRAIEVNAIPPMNHYAGPTADEATLCLCSTVTYSLVSACGGCQNRTFTDWLTWNAACSSVEVAQFLQPIPAQVIVPTWAYLDVTKTNNTFDATLANQSVATSSSSSAAPSSTSSAATLPSPTPSVPPPPSPTTASPKKSNAGAIAGGVVGGLVLLVAAALAILFCLHRNRPRQQSSDHHPASSFSAPAQSMDQYDPRSVASPTSTAPYPYHQDRFAKDPSETETYPGSAIASVAHTTFDTPSVMTPAVQIVHRYNHAAEV